MLTRSQFDRAQPLLALGFSVILVAVIGVSIWRDSRSGGGAAGPSSVDTGPFDGRYRLVADESFMSFREELAKAEAEAEKLESSGNTPDASLMTKIAGLRFLLRSYEEQFDNFTVRRGVIRSGLMLMTEFSLIRATIEGNTLDGVAVWHEDVFDPGDSHKERIRLTLIGDRLEFVIGESEEAERVILERIPKDDDSG